jgi:hypothetical protein
MHVVPALSRDPSTTNVDVALSWGHNSVYNGHRWLWVPAQGRDDESYPSSTASAPLTASALSITVRSSAPACTEMFSAKNRASVT